MLSKEQKEFIKQAEMHFGLGCGKKLFPEAFEFEYEKGRWYIDDDGRMVLFNGEFGESGNPLGDCITPMGIWIFNEPNAGLYMPNPRLATEEEILTALTKEAKKKGLIDGVWFESLTFKGETRRVCEYQLIKGCSLYSGGGYLYLADKNKWAKPIEQSKDVTMEDVCEKFGYNVKIVKK